jgi:phage terminase large subunit
MKQIANKIYKPLFQDNYRYAICMGGRAGGRSFTASQFALAKLVAPEYFRCAIMRYVLGDIRNSIYQEIIDRAEEQGIKEALDIKENNLVISYGQNKINGIGFRKSSGDQKAKLKSLANYNCVIIEEADEVAEEDFMQLDDSLRTLKSDIRLILLLNPPHKSHWIIKRWFNLLPSGVDGFYKAEKKDHKDTVHIFGTYEDNRKNLNQSTIENFERYKENRPDHYYNMIKGLVSEGARGRVFKDWKPITIQEYKELPYTITYGLDFGFSNSPTAVVEIKQHNDNIYLREVLYETGLTNQAIARRLKGTQEEIIADSAEPKSIEELQQEGLIVRPAEKGKDSVNAGIDYLLSKNVYYTEDSENLAIELQNYKWALDKNKEPTNKPVDAFDHLIDATRYGVFRKQEFIGFA